MKTIINIIKIFTFILLSIPMSLVFLIWILEILFLWDLNKKTAQLLDTYRDYF